jgi:hypothetical protein
VITIPLLSRLFSNLTTSAIFNQFGWSNTPCSSFPSDCKTKSKSRTLNGKTFLSDTGTRRYDLLSPHSHPTRPGSDHAQVVSICFNPDIHDEQDIQIISSLPDNEAEYDHLWHYESDTINARVEFDEKDSRLVIHSKGGRSWSWNVEVEKVEKDGFFRSEVGTVEGYGDDSIMGLRKRGIKLLPEK